MKRNQQYDPAKASIPNLDSFNNPSEVFEAAEGIIKAACVSFASKFGGDIDEYIAESNYWFIARTIPTYDPSWKRSFSSWTRMRTFNHLLDKHRTKASRNERLPRDNSNYIDEELDRHHFDARAFKRSVSRDAAVVIHQVIGNTTLQPALRAAGYGLSKAQTKTTRQNPAKVREALRMEMVEFWDWSDERVDTAFAEVEEALLS